MKPILVIKLGSQVLLNADGYLDLLFVKDIARQLAAVVTAGFQPIVVSSGAIACGRSVMQDPAMDVNLADQQALAAIGQVQLVHHWQLALDAHGLKSAQLLLTNDDFSHRLRYLNISSTLRSLFAHGVIPVVNENDTVAVEEITLGDNDRLSAMLAGQIQAQQLLILTDIDGVYNKNPHEHADAVLLKDIHDIDDDFIQRSGGASSGTVGRGGMRSKLVAAQIAAEAGVPTRIVAGRSVNVLTDIINGQAVGTLVHPRNDQTPDSRKHWLALARRCEGELHIDAGAAEALLHKGKSLLPVGITRVVGDFERGASVSILDPAGREIARGLSGMHAADLLNIQGMRMDQAAETIGHVLPKAAVHRDDLWLLNN